MPTERTDSLPNPWLVYLVPNAASLFHVLLSVSTLILMCILVQETRAARRDTATTLSDVQKFVPEVRRSLGILKSICEAPEFWDYCGTP